MANIANPQDMVEEDAADLQFPKGIGPQSEKSTYTVQYYHQNSEELDEDREFCKFCQVGLFEPFIQCKECDAVLCLSCFAKGAEVSGQHRNYHRFSVKRDDNISIFGDPVWTGKEEKLLLNGILIHGFGNWAAIAKSVATKTDFECKKHYMDNYFDGQMGKRLKLTNLNCYFPERNPFELTSQSIDPPRHHVDSSNFKLSGGYRFARGDFDQPFDPTAEAMVSNLDLNDPEMEELNLATFRAYNHRLRERQRRYEIIKRHGLILTNKMARWYSTLAISQMDNKDGGNGRFLSFLQLLSGIGFDKFVQRYEYGNNLKKYLFRLYELRGSGVTSFYGGKVFYKLSERRKTNLSRDKKREKFEQMFDWRKIEQGESLPFAQSKPEAKLINVIFQSPPNKRRKMQPLDVIGMPGYEKLLESERQLCSTARLEPQSYLEYKRILIHENQSSNFVRLADARKIIKIDVNKTRQIYDYLIENGFINRPPPLS